MGREHDILNSPPFLWEVALPSAQTLISCAYGAGKGLVKPEAEEQRVLWCVAASWELLLPKLCYCTERRWESEAPQAQNYLLSTEASFNLLTRPF